MSNQPPPLPSSSASIASSKNWERDTLEKLLLASIYEQRTARRWKIGLRIASLIFFALIIWTLLQRTATSGINTARIELHTAVIEIQGVIADDADANAKDIVENAKAAFENSNAKAVILLINSPGGSPVQAGIISDELLRLKTKYKKPLYAVVSDSCTSGAYYIAVAADKIFVDKASVIGSIGVLMNGFGFTGTMEKIGVDRRLLTAGKNKAMLDPFSPVDPQHQAYAQAMLEQIHQQFIDVVRKNRGTRLQETPEMFSGLIWTGQQAVQLGLADQLGNIDFVARDVVKQENLVDYTQRDNVAERLAKKFGASVGAGAVRALQSQPHLQ